MILPKFSLILNKKRYIFKISKTLEVLRRKIFTLNWDVVRVTSPNFRYSASSCSCNCKKCLAIDVIPLRRQRHSVAPSADYLNYTSRREDIKRSASNRCVSLRFITWRQRGVYYPPGRDVQIASLRDVT